MVKVKKARPVKDVEVEIKDTPVNEEKPQVVSSKEKICEFYWITDSEILNPATDYSKFWISAEEESVLRQWWVEHMKVTAKNVTFDIYEQDDAVRAILHKYGVTPSDVAEDKLDELWLNGNEKEVITDYYYKRAGVQNTHI